MANMAATESGLNQGDFMRVMRTKAGRKRQIAHDENLVMVAAVERTVVRIDGCVVIDFRFAGIWM